jgi:hypothetical protein
VFDAALAKKLAAGGAADTAAEAAPKKLLGAEEEEEDEDVPKPMVVTPILGSRVPLTNSSYKCKEDKRNK